MMPEQKHNQKKLVDYFLGSAARHPDRTALEIGHEQWSYTRLMKRAESIAGSILASRYAGPVVAVQADKSFDCYAGILGILMSGKGYLPLNPRFPATRNQFMLEKTGTGMVMDLGKPVLTATSQVPLADRDPAYILFTSGTTGEPKGVLISNEKVTAYIDFMLNGHDMGPEDRFTQNFDLTFDLSVHDLFLCWAAGACLCVPEDASSFRMAGFIKEKKPTCWFSVPSVAVLMDRMRLLKPVAFPSIRLSFFCGEPLFVETARSWNQAAPGSRIINLYGPTEATIAISRYKLPSEGQNIKHDLGIVSIGRIFEGHSFQVKGYPETFTEDNRGELCLTGPQVIDHYIDNPGADKLAFYTGEDSGEKYYKTGDQVRLDDEGDIFFLGRSDAEVKISGYRVNLAEIENVLRKYDGIDQVVVMFSSGRDLQGELIAFVLPEKGKSIAAPGIVAHCGNILPWYMVPGKIIFVNEFPLNFNGKIDRKAIKERYFDGK